MDDNLPPTGRRCRVCDFKAEGAHFGVDSCRACAAFFRRTLQRKSKFKCSKGACGKPRECKGCRFDRCISSGMLPSLVIKVDEVGKENIPAVVTSHPKIIFLQRLLANYKDLTRDRIISEQEFLTSNPEYEVHPYQNTPPNEQQNFKIFTSQYLLINQISRESTTHLKNFLTCTFEGMVNLDEAENFQVLQNCFFVLYNAEGVYRASKAYKERPLECLFTSYTTAHRYTEFESFYAGSEPEKKSPLIIPECRRVYLEIRDILVPIFDRIQPTELELLASMSIAMWSLGASRFNERISEIRERYCKRIFYELHFLYRDEFNLDNYASRLGELMTLVNALEHASLSLIRFFRWFDVFKVHEEGSFTSEIVMPPFDKRDMNDNDHL